jgi:uncharacterized LabA/DUF88 family protein
MSNQAFIDAQNMIAGTSHAEKPWKVDLKKFRKFLSEKYDVKTAYYFIGVYDKTHENLYKFLAKTGYTVMFREHAGTQLGKKKGNVDTDIVFSIMDAVYRRKAKGKIVLVTGDGDYFKTVNRLAKDKKLRVIMFPNPHWSSLYNQLADNHKIRLYTREVRQYLEYKKPK